MISLGDSFEGMEWINGGGTYRVSSSRSSLSAATVSSSSSSSDDMASPRRAFNGINTDANRLSNKKVGETLCSECRLCEMINLQLILVNGALCLLERQHSHACCTHAVEATKNTRSGQQSIY